MTALKIVGMYIASDGPPCFPNVAILREIPEDYSMKNSRGEDVISTNYLGTLVRKYAGLELSADDRYRMNQRAQIPVFNFAGYVTADGDWYDLWA